MTLAPCDIIRATICYGDLRPIVTDILFRMSRDRAESVLESLNSFRLLVPMDPIPLDPDGAATAFLHTLLDTIRLARQFLRAAQASGKTAEIDPAAFNATAQAQSTALAKTIRVAIQALNLLRETGRVRYTPDDVADVASEMAELVLDAAIHPSPQKVRPGLCRDTTFEALDEVVHRVVSFALPGLPNPTPGRHLWALSAANWYLEAIGDRQDDDPRLLPLSRGYVMGLRAARCGARPAVALLSRVGGEGARVLVNAVPAAERQALWSAFRLPEHYVAAANIAVSLGVESIAALEAEQINTLVHAVAAVAPERLGPFSQALTAGQRAALDQESVAALLGHAQSLPPEVRMQYFLLAGLADSTADERLATVSAATEVINGDALLRQPDTAPVLVSSDPRLVPVLGELLGLVARQPQHIPAALQYLQRCAPVVQLAFGLSVKVSPVVVEAFLRHPNGRNNQQFAQPLMLAAMRSPGIVTALTADDWVPNTTKAISSAAAQSLDHAPPARTL